MERTAGDISAYEGLVCKTALMFYELVGLEKEDMQQELWVKVTKARRSYDSTRSKMTERAYVYACIANLVKDLKRDSARRAGRLSFTYIEGFGLAGVADLFEFRHTRATHDEIYGAIEDGFVMPSTVSSDEQEIVYLLVIGYAQTEIAETLGVEYAEVVKRMRVLREKFADWRPTRAPQEPPVVAAPAAIAA